MTEDEKNRDLPKKMRVSKRFRPCPIDSGDELYPNGIFVFNITKMLKFLRSNTDQFRPEEVEVATIPDLSSRLDPATVEKADISAPIILAEIAPGREVDPSVKTKKWSRFVISVPALNLLPGSGRT